MPTVQPSHPLEADVDRFIDICLDNNFEEDEILDELERLTPIERLWPGWMTALGGKEGLRRRIVRRRSDRAIRGLVSR